ncbi:MAG: hypothetical protein B6D58_04105 [candidate division Zixibacteria bacterium 4484_95]|nr:MAG: hypothetical protein B6D58_04105 [candidate division Zixibacteria bacterium 4484_95]RKX18819.1 MAG: hypothetical protein DRP26_04540 [candidate division Zixibacteria bacterium]
MKCYFQGVTREENNEVKFNGYVSFTIPEMGIKFRGQFKGSSDECEYASLLALLEFIELNAHLFKDRRIEIFGNNFKVVSQVNSEMSPTHELEPFCAMAQGYKKKIPYTLNWIPTDENMAQDGVDI